MDGDSANEDAYHGREECAPRHVLSDLKLSAPIIAPGPRQFRQRYRILVVCASLALAAHTETPAAFGRRGILRQAQDVLSLSKGVATLEFHHGPMVLATPSAIVKSEFLFDTAPFASAHASTIVETNSGLVAAWFGGTREGAADVGIWLTRSANGTWEPPIEVATGTRPDGTRYPCWNPVLFALPDSELALFYKVGPSPQRWWGLVKTSRDGGRTWSGAARLPDGILGPIKNKPVRLSSGAIVAGSSTESPERPSSWRVHFERSDDSGRTWTATPPVDSAGTPIEAIQPAILIHPGRKLQAVGRTRSGRVFETWSNDGGSTWTPMALTTLPNPNSGIDAVTLHDGLHLIVYNHTATGRTPLNAALSRDGRTWEAGAVLEEGPGEFSYPAVIQTTDGLVHVTYTWKRQRIKHVVLDPAKLKSSAWP